MGLFAAVIDVMHNEIKTESDDVIRYMSYHPAARDQMFNGELDQYHIFLADDVPCRLFYIRDNKLTSDDLVIVMLSCPGDGSPDLAQGQETTGKALNEFFEIFGLRYFAAGVSRNGSYSDGSASIVVYSVATAIIDQLADSRRAQFGLIKGMKDE